MIILPRPAPHLPRTLAALQAAGFNNIHALAASNPQAVSFTLPANATAIIITSRFGVPQNLPQRHLPTYCVGGCTALAAKAAGFNVTYTGINNGDTMAQDILNHATGTPHHFIHLHGDHAGMDWHAILKQAGHTVTPVLAYQTHHITALPAQSLAAFAAANPHTLTLLFSAGSASHLAKLCKQANIAFAGTALALSPAVAKAAAPHWPQVVTAPAPTLEGMLQALHTLNTGH